MLSLTPRRSGTTGGTTMAKSWAEAAGGLELGAVEQAFRETLADAMVAGRVDVAEGFAVAIREIADERRRAVTAGPVVDLAAVRALRRRTG
jgi:hypothetical protein